MRRLSNPSLALTSARDGVLFVDEVSLGLHYSTLGAVRLFIVEAANRHNIQVFLRPHGADCIRALAWLCEERPELAPRGFDPED